jgi:ABC-2 type transport system permease protein
VSARTTARALPTLLRIGVHEAIAYRGEMIVWMLATTMPLVMLALWSAVARDAPVGRYGEPQLVGYFLAAFIVRQLTGAWVFYTMNFEIRDGTLSMRLLRPVHPLIAYAAEGIASMPMRVLISLPVAAISLAVVGAGAVTHDLRLWALWVVSIAGAWLISLFVNFAVGCTAFFAESSMKFMDAWLVFYFVLSGYVVPVDLFPPALRAVVDWLPFRYQIGLPVEVMTGAHTPGETLALLARQWMWVAIGLGTTALMWRRGLRRFAAYGG